MIQSKETVAGFANAAKTLRSILEMYGLEKDSIDYACETFSKDRSLKAKFKDSKVQVCITDEQDGRYTIEVDDEFCSLSCETVQVKIDRHGGANNVYDYINRECREHMVLGPNSDDVDQFVDDRDPFVFRSGFETSLFKSASADSGYMCGNSIVEFEVSFKSHGVARVRKIVRVFPAKEPERSAACYDVQVPNCPPIYRPHEYRWGLKGDLVLNSNGEVEELKLDTNYNVMVVKFRTDNFDWEGLFEKLGKLFLPGTYFTLNSHDESVEPYWAAWSSKPSFEFLSQTNLWMSSGDGMATSVSTKTITWPEVETEHSLFRLP